MLLFKRIAELRHHLSTHREKCQLGLVPTMGALHQGHLSLIKRAISDNDLVIVSIFVNPLQFSPTEDLEHYPRQLELDSQLCQQLGVDFIFAPTVAEMNIAENINAQSENTIVLPPNDMISVLCGKFRPGHFQGVATIVTKLLNIVQPDRAYFGQKDAQQLAIIRRLVADLNLPVEIIDCPIIREKSGLALSSRNQYLNPKEKQQATEIYRSLQQAATAFEQGENNTLVLIDLVKQALTATPEIKIQYVELVDPETLTPIENVKTRGLLAIAVYLGNTRLIDNIMLQQRRPIIAIDGPAGAGKSTVTRQVAHQLGLLYLDTGAMYRAVTWLVMESGIEIDDENAIASLIKDVDIELVSPIGANLPTEVLINGKEVTQAIRTPEVTAQVSAISAQKAVRKALVSMQQSWGEKGGVIAEGRDIGTNVFPDAELKIFLTASPEERARRRSQDLQNQGYEDIDLKQLVQDIQQRDEKDSNRAIAPLKQAEDAIKLVTDGLTVEEVIEKIVNLYHQVIK